MKGEDGNVPIMLCTQYASQRIDMFKLLISYEEIDLNISNDRGETPIFELAHRDDRNRAEQEIFDILSNDERCRLDITNK